MLKALSLAAALALAPFAAATAQDYPTKPVTLVVPFAPGGSSDVISRLVGQKLAEMWKQSVIVDNKAGGAGQIAMQAVARAAPDGYTLVLGHIGTLAVNPAMFEKLSYDYKKEFVPVAMLAIVPSAIAVNPSLPVKDIKELIAYAKANPGKLSYATSGIGTSNHLATELLQSVAGIQLTHVPYKGSSQIVPDLISGTVLMSMESSLATTLQHVRGGKLRAIAVTSAKRSSALPDVPTVAESGYPGFEVETWFGLVAPAATPAAVVARLRDAWAEGAKGADAQAAFDNISANLRATTPAEFGAFIQAEDKRWGELIRKLGIKAD